ncbi:hypothetical protein A593_13500 [Klebsiella variicola]|nr:hypothetical protein A593_13500 [Klebsiella variicola]
MVKRSGNFKLKGYKKNSFVRLIFILTRYTTSILKGKKETTFGRRQPIFVQLKVPTKLNAW